MTTMQLARVDGESRGLMPAMTAAQGVERYNQLVHFVQQIMKKDKDFGVIPGTDKPTLLKPGAEKLCSFFGLAPDFENVGHVENWDAGFFHYVYKCVLSRGSDVIAAGIGSANSKEKRYRWRSIPVWKASDQEKARAHHTEQRGKGPKKFTFYIVENDDPYSLVNTLQKMAQKRALVAAVLVAANASEFFTQDVEDLQTLDPIDGEVVDPQTGEVKDAPDLSNTEDFLLLWDNACEGKQLDIPTGRELLDGLCAKKGLTPANAPVEVRDEMLRMLRSQNPDSINRIKQRAAQKNAAAPDAEPGRATCPASSTEGVGETREPAPSSAPDVSGADAEPPPQDDPDAEAKERHEQWLATAEEVFQEKGIAEALPVYQRRADFLQRMGKVYVGNGVKGKEWTLTPAQRSQVVKDIGERRGYFA